MIQTSASTELPRALLDAYRATEYRVHMPGGSLVLRIGRHDPGLAALMNDHDCTTAAYITACNPRSRVCDEDWNRRAQERLKARLDASGWTWIDGLGVDPDGTHPGEPSVLVLGIEPADAHAVGCEFEQDAIVVAGADATPRLALLR